MSATKLAAGVVLALGLLVGCTKANPDYCEQDRDCPGGRVCLLYWNRCMSPTAFGPLDAGGEAGTAVDGPAGPGADVPIADDGPAPYDVPQSGEAAAPLDTSPGDGAIRACLTSADCLDPAHAFCVAGQCAGCALAGGGVCGTQVCDERSGRCVECTLDSQCGKDPSRPFCVANVCAACQAATCAARTDGKTVCATSGSAAGQCVECTANGECTKDPIKAFCVANACSDCRAAGPSSCRAHTDGKTLCATSGPSVGRCVECMADSQCTQDPAKAFCVANTCTGCNTAGATGCAARTDGKTLCATSGTVAGRCVECTSESQCSKDANKSFCVANACAGCQAAPTTACSARSAAKPLCGTAGNCVECNTSNDCSTVTKPICTVGECGACTADSQCASKLGTSGNPGVCMGHLDGHCATDAETVYVGATSGGTCSEANAGTAQAPVCSALGGVGLAKAGGKPLVVVRGTSTAGTTIVAATSPITIVGKNGATLSPAAAGADALTITSGTVYLRDLTIQGSSSPASGIGINAGTGAGSNVVLHMDHCRVVNNPACGIALNGAAFDIKNTTVSGNGANATSPPWGGIYIVASPASGPSSLANVTIQSNNGGGLSCPGPITGTGVRSVENTNTPTQIVSTCGFASCTPGGGLPCGAP